MSIRSPQRRVRVPGRPRTVRVDDFRHGVDLRQRPDSGRSPWAKNVTSDGRNLVKRWGAVHKSTLAEAGVWIHWSLATRDLLVQRGATVYAYDLDINGALSNVRTVYTFLNSAKVSATDLGGYAWISGGGSTGRVVRWDGLTATVATSAAGGGPIATWQNKLWTSSGDSTRLDWSAAGDGMTWDTSNNFVFIREPDDARIKAIGSGTGIDVVGRGGLFVFKEQSIHRVVDSETGEYVTVETENGAPGQEAVTTLDGTTYLCNDDGIWVVTETGTRYISDPIAPLWDDGRTGEHIPDEFIAWQQHGRLYFARDDLDLFFEYDPAAAAWWPHSLNDAGTARSVMSAATQVPDSTYGEYSYALDSGGTKVLRLWDPPRQGGTVSQAEDYVSSTATATYVLPWVDFGLDRMQVQRVLVEGWGTAVTVSARKDGDNLGVSLGTKSLHANIFGDNDLVGHVEVFGVGFCRSLALEFGATVSNIMVFYDELGLRRNRPNFGLSAVRLDVVPLK